jgi:hypothetical protein
MPVEVTCPTCGAKLKAPDAAIGKRAKCGKCRNPVLVTPPSTASSTPLPPPTGEPEPFPTLSESENPFDFGAPAPSNPSRPPASASTPAANPPPQPPRRLRRMLLPPSPLPQNRRHSRLRPPLPLPSPRVTPSVTPSQPPLPKSPRRNRPRPDTEWRGINPLLIACSTFLSPEHSSL